MLSGANDNCDLFTSHSTESRYYTSDAIEIRGQCNILIEKNFGTRTQKHIFKLMLILLYKLTCVQDIMWT